MSLPLNFPVVNGYRYSFSSVEFKLNGRLYVGFKSVNYGRKRNRALVRGNNPDPLAKTRGENEYNADVEMYLSEFNQMINDIGSGYGDVSFSAYVTYGENGSDTIQDVLLGCTIDSSEASNAQGPDPTVRKFEIAPIKILFNGLDDLQIPLVGPPQ